MKARAPRLVAGLAVALTSGALVLPSITRPASADPITHTVHELLTQPGYPVFLVQDLGGGAYWVPSTGIHYVVAAGSEILFMNPHTLGDYVAVLQANGRDLLLLINGATLKPIKEALGGQ